MSEKEIKNQIQQLDGELSIIINTLIVIASFFIIELILLIFNFISIDILSILGLVSLGGMFYLKLKSAKMKARILVILESLDIK